MTVAGGTPPTEFRFKESLAETTPGPATRVYTIDDDTGLPISMTAGGVPLLRGPVRVSVNLQDTEVDPSVSPVSVLTNATGGSPDQYARATYTRGAKHTGTGLRVVTTATLEYDGYMGLEIRLQPTGQSTTVTSVSVVIPLMSDQATHLHVASQQPTKSGVSMALGAGPALWDSRCVENVDECVAPGRQLTSKVVNPMRVGSFKPYVWVGNAQRGLAFMADNDRGWVPENGAPAIEVRRVTQDNSVELVLNIISSSFIITNERVIRFSLQAVPVRPVPADVRSRIGQLHNETVFPPYECVNPGCLRNDGSSLLGYYESGPAYPLDIEKGRTFAQDMLSQQPAGFPNGRISTPYQVLDRWKSVWELAVDPQKTATTDPLQGANLWGYLSPEITATWMDGDATLTAVDAKYRLWRYRYWIRAAGLKGMYFDTAWPAASGIARLNPDDTDIEDGPGYVLDLGNRPETGLVQPGYSLTGLRQFFRNLRAIFAQPAEGYEPVTEPYIVLHGSNSIMASAYAFADYVLDGENNRVTAHCVPGLDCIPAYFSDVWPAAELQVASIASRWGFGLLFDAHASLPSGIDPSKLSNFVAYLALHDMDSLENHYFWQGNGFVREDNWLDLSATSSFFPYWSKDTTDGATLTARTGEGAFESNPNVVASVWTQGSTRWVLLFNKSADFLNARWTLTAGNKFGLTSISGACEAASNAEATVRVVEHEDGTTTTEPLSGPMSSGQSFELDISPHQWRLVKLLATGTCQ